MILLFGMVCVAGYEQSECNFHFIRSWQLVVFIIKHAHIYQLC